MGPRYLGYCEQCGYFEGKCGCGKGKIILRFGQRVKISKFLSGLLRHFAPVLLEVDAQRMAYDGYRIKKKGNVYTSDVVPPQYINIS